MSFKSVKLDYLLEVEKFENALLGSFKELGYTVTNNKGKVFEELIHIGKDGYGKMAPLQNLDFPLVANDDDHGRNPYYDRIKRTYSGKEYVIKRKQGIFHRPTELKLVTRYLMRVDLGGKEPRFSFKEDIITGLTMYSHDSNDMDMMELLQMLYNKTGIEMTING